MFNIATLKYVFIYYTDESNNNEEKGLFHSGPTKKYLFFQSIAFFVCMVALDHH